MQSNCRVGAALPRNHSGVYQLRPTETPMGETIIASWIPNSGEERSLFYLARCSLGRWTQPRACLGFFVFFVFFLRSLVRNTMHKYGTASLRKSVYWRKISPVTRREPVYLTFTSKNPRKSRGGSPSSLSETHEGRYFSFFFFTHAVGKAELCFVDSWKRVQIAGDSELGWLWGILTSWFEVWRDESACV